MPICSSLKLSMKLTNIDFLRARRAACYQRKGFFDGLLLIIVRAKEKPEQRTSTARKIEFREVFVAAFFSLSITQRNWLKVNKHHNIIITKRRLLSSSFSEKKIAPRFSIFSRNIVSSTALETMKNRPKKPQKNCFHVVKCIYLNYWIFRWLNYSWKRSSWANLIFMSDELLLRVYQTIIQNVKRRVRTFFW